MLPACLAWAGDLQTCLTKHASFGFPGRLLHANFLSKLLEASPVFSFCSGHLFGMIDWSLPLPFQRRTGVGFPLFEPSILLLFLFEIRQIPS